MVDVSGNIDCCCQPAPAGKEGILQAFGTVRHNCPALRQIFLSDEVWTNFAKLHTFLDAADHESFLLLAYERGYLGKITSPVHRYLMSGALPLAALTPQYRADLQEKWLDVKETEGKKAFEFESVRHEISRIYISRIAELMIAEWLEQSEYTIRNLEAVGANHDIECVDSSGALTCVEVKYIGERNSDFLKATGLGGHGNPNIYQLADIALSKAYEAAQQLRGAGGRRVAIIVFGASAIQPFKLLPFKENWFDWSAPRFYGKEECGAKWWDEFLTELKKKYPEIEKDLAAVLSSLNELWLVAEEIDMNFNLICKQTWPAIEGGK